MNYKDISGDEAADLIRSAKNIIAWTGAGVSVAAGIPTYRSQGGSYQLLGQRTFEYGFRSSIESRSAIVALFRMMRDAQPTSWHKMEKRLKDCDRIQRIYTTNVDGLEEAAGLDSFAFEQSVLEPSLLLPTVIPMHGSIHYVYCDAACKRYWPMKKWDLLFESEEHLMCMVCKFRAFVADKEDSHNLRPRLNLALKGPGSIRTAIELYDTPIAEVQSGLQETILKAQHKDSVPVDVVLVAGSSLVERNRESLRSLKDMIIRSASCKPLTVIWINLKGKPPPAGLCNIEGATVVYCAEDAQLVARKVLDRQTHV